MNRLLVVAVLFLGCGPKSDLAQSKGRLVQGAPVLKPNVMVLLDGSGSMLLPLDASAASCPAGCGTSPANLCPTSCPTRLTEAKSGLASFFAQSPAFARVGVTIFPSDPVCGPPSEVGVDLPAAATDDSDVAALQATADAANARVQAMIPIGGTPTGASLEFVGALPSMQNTQDGRDEWVVLITDGLPNCSEQNPNALCSHASPSAVDLMACACTTTTCSGALCSKGCLDDQKTVDVVESLRQRGIRTVVIGFGADTSTTLAQTVFGSIATAGGFSRKRADGLAAEPYLQTRGGSELSAALDVVLTETKVKPCTFSLSELPAEGEVVAAFRDGARVDAALVSLDAAKKHVTISDATCGAYAFRLER
ncbi:MAG: adventurous gliding motility lipoprotein CglB [Archangium sp.]